MPDHKQHGTKARNISLTTQEAVRLRQMGFTLFKLQGRLDIPTFFFSLIFSAIRWKTRWPSLRCSPFFPMPSEGI